MKFSDFARKWGHDPLLFEEIYRSGCLEIRPDGYLCFNDLMLSKASKRVLQKLIQFKNDSKMGRLETYLATTIYGEGPKVFRPKSQQLKLLHEMTINLHFDEYQQPFNTTILELPEDYCATKIIDDPCRAECTEIPLFSILRKAPEIPVIFHSMLFSSGNSLKSWMHFTPDRVIEDWFDFIKDQNIEGMATSDAEMDLASEIRRIHLNYNLLIDETGSKRIGADNEKNRERLLKSTHPTVAARHKQEGKCIPVYYDIHQEVKLFTAAKRLPSNGEPTGRITSPHIRRGHYRMQRYGQGLKKRIRIKPIFVNSHLFLGDMWRTLYEGE